MLGLQHDVLVLPVQVRVGNVVLESARIELNCYSSKCYVISMKDINQNNVSVKDMGQKNVSLKNVSQNKVSMKDVSQKNEKFERCWSEQRRR